MVAANISENVGNPQASRKVRKVPNYLVWETLDGQPLYRRGYKDVMRKTKTLEEIMGTSSYQSIINSYLLGILFTQIDLQKYDILTNEIGVHFKKNDNASNDIAIYKRLESAQITKKYTDFAAKIVIEIDIDIDPDSMPDLEYLDKKTQKMLDFGVEKVIWILTNIKKVMVATPNNPWYTIDWSNDIEIMDGISFNIEKYLIERGVK
jgi:hypothetical protein